jgi:hypothetical protein
MSSDPAASGAADEVPPILRKIFVFHFFADLGTAIPLFFFPVQALTMLGWTVIDPGMTRVVAAALTGIGVQSLLCHRGVRSYVAALQTKAIWSLTAIAGILWSVLTGGPVMLWGFLGVFVAFSLTWWYWLIRLTRRPE